MSKGGCLVIRWGAYGDLLYALPLLEHLKKKHGYLHLECTPQGRELFAHHPSIDEISTFSVWEYPPEQQEEVSKIRWEALQASGWDRVVNLWQTLEVSCIAEKHQKEFFMPRELRRRKYGHMAFHDAPWMKAEETIPDPFHCGTFYFPEDIVWWMQSFRQRHEEDFIVTIPVRGHAATPQKQPFGIKDVAEAILDKYPEAKIFTVGDEHGKPYEFNFGDGRVCNTSGTMSFLQTMALLKLSDFAFGVESGLLVAAGLFGTPKTALCTASGVYQVTKYHKNDFSIQSYTQCSPCHRAIYDSEYCLLSDFGTGHVPACNGEWYRDRVFQGVDFAYRMRWLRREVEDNKGPGFASLPDLHSLSIQGVRGNEEVRLRVLQEVSGIREDSDGDPPEPGKVEAPGDVPAWGGKSTENS